MNRVRSSLACAVVACLVVTVVLGGCYSRSALKEAQEAGTVACPPPCPPPCTPCPPPCRPTAAAPTVQPAADIQPLPAPGASESAKQTSRKYGRPGFVVYEEDGRLWVFEQGSDALQSFLAKGEPAKRVTKIGVGPDGKTVMSSDSAVIDDYVARTRYALDGFDVRMEDGRLWVFKLGTDAHKQFVEKGEPAKRVTKIGVGPDGKTVMSADTETIDEYVTARKYGLEGWDVRMEDGRLWVFKMGTIEHADFLAKGEPAKRVTKIGVGPDGKTVMSSSSDMIDEYVAEAKYGRPGFVVFLIDKRIWVFKAGSNELTDYLSVGEPAKRITRIGVGPDGKSVIGPDNETLDAYLATWR